MTEATRQREREPMSDCSAPRPSEHKLEVQAEMLTCRHFNGVQHDCCEAGVNYRELAGGPPTGCMTRIPCLPMNEPKNGSMAVCEKRDRWTKLEAELNVTRRSESMQRHMLAFRKVHDDAKAKGYKKNHGGVSECVCPICAGAIRYSVASYNGHLHAKCETEGCVQWME